MGNNRACKIHTIFVYFLSPLQIFGIFLCKLCKYIKHTIFETTVLQKKLMPFISQPDLSAAFVFLSLLSVVSTGILDFGILFIK